MLYGVLDYATREFRYARAGHDAPLIIKAPHLPMIPRLGHSQPLGIFPDSPLDTHRIELARDDVLVMFTDGITEAMNERNELFGAERLRDSALARCHLSAQTMCERLIDDISRYRGSAPQSDDIALVVVRVK